MSGYGALAGEYNGLMQGVDYAARADYLLSVFRRHGCDPKTLTDLACGTGTLTCLLAQKGIEMIGVDGSAEMLCRAREADGAEKVLWICQDLRELDLYGTTEGAISTLDSLNHLTGDSDLERFFGRLQYFIEPGGLFVFDVNTEYKHLQVLADRTFVYDTPEAYCVWQNRTDPQTAVTQISLDLFEKQGETYRRTAERFCERAYSAEQIQKAATAFTVEAVYDDMTFDPPSAECQRAVYVLKKN